MTGSGSPRPAPVVRTRRLTKRYGDVTALDALDLEIGRGEVLGYLGPNGAGKSTTLALLLGLVAPTSGTAEIFGLDARGDAARIHRRVGFVPSDVELWPSLTAGEVLRLLGDLHGGVDVGHREELVDRFELDVTRRIRALSHGNRRKVLLIAALAPRPDLLLLDEPTSGLDPLMAQVFQACIREAAERGQTVLLSSHVLSEVDAVCDRVAMLRDGRLVEVGDLAVLRGLAAVRFEVEPAVDLSGVPGVSHLEVEGGVLRGRVTGSMAPLLRAVGEAGVPRLTTHRPTLEELFVARYEEPERAAAVTGP